MVLMPSGSLFNRLGLEVWKSRPPQLSILLLLVSGRFVSLFLSTLTDHLSLIKLVRYSGVDYLYISMFAIVVYLFILASTVFHCSSFRLFIMRPRLPIQLNFVQPDSRVGFLSFLVITTYLPVSLLYQI